MTQGASLSRLGRGMFKKSGRMSTDTKFVWDPNWKKNTREAVEPTGRQHSNKVHQAMGQGMQRVSRRSGGGGVHKTDEGWDVDIGQPASTHTHWHLIEFGGGHHPGRAPVRNAIRKMGKFKASKGP
jgi:hypothetical protein